VRARVYHTIRQNNQIVAIRQQNFTAFRRSAWLNHMTQVRMFSVTRVTHWYPDWLAHWRPPRRIEPQIVHPQPIQQQPTGGGQQRDPNRITVKRLAEMMDDAHNYMTHGTGNASVGTLEEPLIGIEDQSQRVNSVAPVGVYAWRGIVAAAESGYGPYYVIMDANTGYWRQQGAHWFRPGTAAIPRSDIIGYCTREDIDAAKALRASGR
jgi:hypothetical protein